MAECHLLANFLVVVATYLLSQSWSHFITLWKQYRFSTPTSIMFHDLFSKKKTKSIFHHTSFEALIREFLYKSENLYFFRSRKKMICYKNSSTIRWMFWREFLKNFLYFMKLNENVWNHDWEMKQLGKKYKLSQIKLLWLEKAKTL